MRLRKTREEIKERALRKQLVRQARDDARQAERQREIDECGSSPTGHVWVQSPRRYGRAIEWCVGCHHYNPHCWSKWG